MKKSSRLLLLLFFAALSACNSGSDDDYGQPGNPPPPSNLPAPAGVYLGSSSTADRDYLAVNLTGQNSGSFFWLFSDTSQSITNSVAGFISGTLNVGNPGGSSGSLTASNVVNFDLADSGIKDTGTTLNTNSSYTSNALSINLTHDSSSINNMQMARKTPVASIEELADMGPFDADLVSTHQTVLDVEITIDSQGNLTGSVTPGACEFQGYATQLSAHPKGVFSLLISSITDCGTDNSAGLTGVVFSYSGQLYLAAANTDMDDGIVLIGASY